MRTNNNTKMMKKLNEKSFDYLHFGEDCAAIYASLSGISVMQTCKCELEMLTHDVKKLEEVFEDILEGFDNIDEDEIKYAFNTDGYTLTLAITYPSNAEDDD